MAKDSPPLAMSLAGDIIEAIGSHDFPATLASTLNLIVPYNYTVVFGYHGSAPPLDLFDDFPVRKRRIHVEDYQAGPYLLDPFYLATRSDRPSGLYRLRELAPDRFYQGEYFRSYYGRTGLAEEIAFIARLPLRATVIVSLMRADKAFTVKEMRELEKFRPVALSACKRHWEGLSQRFGAGVEAGESPRERNLDQALREFGDGLLTPREREIVEYTLKGHSAAAIGEILGIAPGTVRIHRRNIYSKLRIRSQGELFSGFIETLLAGG